MKEFDEDDAIEFVKKHIPAESAAQLTDDDTIIEIIDLSFDFFDELSDDDDFEIAVEDGQIVRDDNFKRLAGFISKAMKKSGSKLSDAAIADAAAAELLYENSLD